MKPLRIRLQEARKQTGLPWEVLELGLHAHLDSGRNKATRPYSKIHSETTGFRVI
jgi:hypothetical protein